MAKLEAKTKAALKDAPVASVPSTPTPAEAAAPLENVDIKLSPEMAENLRPMLDQVEASLGDGDEPAPYATGVQAERIYIISAPGGPRRRANLAFGPEPRELVWEDLGDTDEAREHALDALRADPLIKIDGRYEERPLED